MKNVYGVSIESGFSAVHQLPLPEGGMEPLHGHDWKVVIHVEGSRLDESGVLVDFVRVKAGLEEILGPWNHKNLNEMKEFSSMPPSAEAVAEAIFRSLAPLVEGASHALQRVVVTEAPSCRGSYGKPGFVG